jgi:Mor family transcriptional regulator
MAAVYKVQNMQLIVDNTIHPAAVFEEDEEATADHHSVAVVDLIVEVEEVVLRVPMNQVLVHNSKPTVHRWLDVHLLADHHELLVVL